MNAATLPEGYVLARGRTVLHVLELRHGWAPARRPLCQASSPAGRPLELEPAPIDIDTDLPLCSRCRKCVRHARRMAERRRRAELRRKGVTAGQRTIYDELPGNRPPDPVPLRPGGAPA